MNAASFLLGFAFALALTAGVLAAVYGYLKHGRRSKPAIAGYLDLIPDLTDEQRARVQEIRRVFLPKVEGIRQDMRRRRAELSELLFADPADRSAIDEASAEIVRRQSELEREVIGHILEERELLTASQRRRFYEIIVEQFSSGGLGVHDLKRN
ncbi:MAG: Spy/CpxP family protein refolding chaperone [Syntrophobacteraceae bacterium]